MNLFFTFIFKQFKLHKLYLYTNNCVMWNLPYLLLQCKPIKQALDPQHVLAI